MLDYHSLLQEAAVLETKIRQLEVNGLWGEETAEPLSQTREQEHANEQLTS